MLRGPARAPARRFFGSERAQASAVIRGEHPKPNRYPQHLCRPKPVPSSAILAPAIKRVSDDFQALHFNTSIGRIMELVNELYAAEGAQASGVPTGSMSEKLNRSPARRSPARSRAPARAVCALPWRMSCGMLGRKDNLLRVAWPKYDAVLAKEEGSRDPVQINGKAAQPGHRGSGMRRRYDIDGALADEKIRAAIVGKQIVKTIVVPGQAVNIVVR